LSRQSRESLVRIAGVSKRRLESLPTAALVLRRLIRAAEPKNVIFSANGLREGICHAGLSDRVRREDPLLAATREIAAREGRFGDRGAELLSFTAPLFENESA